MELDFFWSFFCLNESSDKMARHHYYLQMKENVVNYGLDSLSEERAFLLASISLQADLGNYNQDKHARNYFNSGHYFPSWVIINYLIILCPKHLSLHCGLRNTKRKTTFSTAVHSFPQEEKENYGYR